MIYAKHISNAEVILFADDTNILVIDKNINTLQGKTKRVMTQNLGFLKIIWF
jgi:hypothetical protein